MIVVIGAGLIGLSIAYELAKRGAEVRVIDAERPAGAASWAGAGMLAPFTEQLAPGAFEEFCARSLAAYPEFAGEVAAASGVDPHLRLDGLVEAAFSGADAARLQARIGSLQSRGIAARWLDAGEARLAEPALGPGVFGASLVEAEGRIDNRRLGRALQAACAARGVRVEANAGTVSLEADRRRVLGVRTRDGFTPADAVVNAAGAWAGELAGVPAAAVVPVTPVKGQMLALAAPRNLVQRVLWVPGAYLVPRDDGRLLVGATVEEAGFDVRVTARGLDELLHAVLAALPALRDLAVSETWAGLRPASPDGLPCIGATPVGGYFVASGHYRNGILLTPATARAVAAAVAGEPADPLLAAFAPARFGQEALAATSAN